jgi:hypothetical protein
MILILLMSDNEWSSDEENNDVPEQRELNMLESEEDSDYEEERQYLLSIMKNKTNNIDLSSLYVNNKKLNKPKKVKEKKEKNTLDIYIEINSEPKKNTWVSKRMDNKKQKEGKVELIKRKFNPRLPLPTLKTFKKKNITYNFTNDDFPSL